jgi:NmrA-like family
LEAALKGQDAVVSTLGYLAESEQTRLIDAAVAAGVKRFIPSEFGIDTTNPKGKALPVFHGKVAAQQYLKEKAASGAISYTFVANGLYLDWGLMVGLIADLKGQKAELYDGGDRCISVSRTSAVGDAIVTVLSRYEDTNNRMLRIQEGVVTQNQLIDIAKKLGKTGSWDTKVVDTAQLESAGHDELGKAEPDPNWRYLFIKRGIWGDGFGGEFAATADNKVLGIKEMSGSEIEEVVKKFL